MAIDPRHEEPPIGDWPNVGFDPLSVAKLPPPRAHFAAGILLVFGVVVVIFAFGVYVISGR